MDAIHYKVKENHQYITKAAYVVLGINLDGQKDILGIWIGENESSKFWLNVLNELKTRGIKDVFLFCVDGLTGFRQAIEAAFPNAQIPALHHSSDTLKHKIRKLQTHQRADG